MDFAWSFELFFPVPKIQKPAPQFQEKRSRSEKAILGALGAFRGILGAALGIGNSILGIRNSILGMASRDLINTKPTILGATLGAIPGIAANPPERFHLALHSRSIFSRIGVVPAHQKNPRHPKSKNPHHFRIFFCPSGFSGCSTRFASPLLDASIFLCRSTKTCKPTICDLGTSTGTTQRASIQ